MPMKTKKKLKRRVIVIARNGGTLSLRQIEKKVAAYNAKIVKSSSPAALTTRNRILQAA